MRTPQEIAAAIVNDFDRGVEMIGRIKRSYCIEQITAALTEYGAQARADGERAGIERAAAVAKKFTSYTLGPLSVEERIRALLPTKPPSPEGGG